MAKQLFISLVERQLCAIEYYAELADGALFLS
jgi:hypothetical protein